MQKAAVNLVRNYHANKLHAVCKLFIFNGGDFFKVYINQ